MSGRTGYGDILYDVSDGVAHIQLNRPEALNAWTPSMGVELLDAVRAAVDDPLVRCVLVTGAGRAFCAGADVKNPRELTEDGVPDLSSRLREIYNPIVLTIRQSPKPFVAAVQGASAGLGVSLALACDLLLAAESSYLLLAFVGIAVMPDGGSTAFLSERVGLTRSEELCMLGHRLPAEKAMAWGLVNRVYPTSQLQPAARELAHRLAAEDPTRMAYVKALLGSSVPHDLAAHLELEADLQQRHGATADYEEGRAAFAGKRSPRFTGA